VLFLQIFVRNVQCVKKIYGDYVTKYKKRPVIIEAFQFGIDEIPDWMNYYFQQGLAEMEEYIKIVGQQQFEYERLLIKTMEGLMKAKIGDFVIKGVENELYPCDPDIFRQTYEIAE